MITFLKQFLNGFGNGMKGFGNNLTIIFNSILLSFVYFFGVGIAFIFAKIFGKRFLDTAPKHKVTSYWSKLNLSEKSAGDYYRQF